MKPVSASVGDREAISIGFLVERYIVNDELENGRIDDREGPPSALLSDPDVFTQQARLF